MVCLFVLETFLGAESNNRDHEIVIEDAGRTD